MGNLWKLPGIPHKGWVLEYAYDIREDGQFVDEDEYETCMTFSNLILIGK